MCAKTTVMIFKHFEKKVKTNVSDPDPFVFGPPGFRSVSQKYGSADPDPYQNVTDPQHC
jgi:hypothetical protein